MITTCKTFHYVVQNDGCYDLAQQYNIALADLYSWNPALNGDCSGLLYGFNICVGVLAAAAPARGTAAPTQVLPSL